MKREKIRYLAGAFVSTLFLLAGAPAVPENITVASPVVPEVITVERLSEDNGEEQEIDAADRNDPAKDSKEVGQDNLWSDDPEAETVAGDNVYPARTMGSYSIQAAYNGGSRNGQYDKYTIAISKIDMKVNINTRRSVVAKADYSGNAGGSLITDMSYANAAMVSHPILYQDTGKTPYNYLHTVFCLHVPQGYKITDVSYSGQGTRGYFYHMFLKNDNMQMNTETKTWNSATSQQLTPAYAATGAAKDIAVRSMVDVFYNAGVGTTSPTYKDAHGSVRQSITVSPVTYTLAFDANGGTGAPAPQGMTYDTAAVLSGTTPQKTGYLFGGWNIGGVIYNAGQTLTASQVSSFSATQSAVVTATAVWKPITYTVAYDLNGGFGAASGQSVAYDASFSLPAAPVREGYLFGGWQFAPGACYRAGESLPAAAFSATNGATVTFSAVWTAGQYTVAFYRSEQDTQPQVVNYVIDENGSLLVAPEKEGYLFTGWKIDGATYTAGQGVRNLTKTNGGKLTAIAQWQPIRYSISFDGNGATEGSTTNQDDLTYDISYKLQPNGFKKEYAIRYDLKGGALDNPIQKVAALFIGWQRQEGEPLIENHAVVSNLTAKNETVILHAVWDDSPLTICLQTPVKESVTQEVTGSSNEQGYETTSYSFEGWEMADGTKLSAGEEVIVGKDLELTALWKEEKTFSPKLPEENETGQILDQLNDKLNEKLDEIDHKLDNKIDHIIQNNYNLTQEQAEEILAAIEDGSAFKLTMGEVQYTIVRNEDGTLSIKLAAMPEGMERIAIPSEVKLGEHTYAITEIYKECFRDNRELKEVTIGNHISKIGESAFAGCSSLTKVQIAEGLIAIGEKAFDGCKSLTVISLPKTVQTIGDAAFRDCASLKKVTLRKGLLTIGNYAFYRCGRLEKVRIPDTVIKIGKYAFARCGKLISVTTSKACTTMGEGVFADCTALKKITLKTALTEVPAKAFYNCKKMTSVKMGSKVTVIGIQAFQNCRKLTSVTIPERVMTIREKAFYKCSSLKKVKITSTHLSAVGKNAFKKCGKGLKFAVPTKKKAAYVKLLKNKY